MDHYYIIYHLLYQSLNKIHSNKFENQKTCRNYVKRQTNYKRQLKSKRTSWCHLLFYFTYVLNMFRTFIYPSSRACDCAVELPHRSFCSTDVVIQQHSRKLLMMDVLMSETCWVHKKWNKIASDIKVVFYSSTITLMHVPINVRKNYKRILLLTNLTYKEGVQNGNIYYYVHSLLRGARPNFEARSYSYECSRRQLLCDVTSLWGWNANTIQ